MESIKSAQTSKSTLPPNGSGNNASRIYSTQNTRADHSSKSIATESSGTHSHPDSKYQWSRSVDASSDGLGGKRSRNTLNKSRSLYQSPSVVAEDFLKNRPNFPANAPGVFLNPETSIITSHQVSQPGFEPVVDALQGMQLVVTPPKLYLRKVAYRNWRPGDATTSSSSHANSSLSAAATADNQHTVSQQSSQPPAPQTPQRRVKVFDIKTELTPYIDTDYLLYNPGALVDYWQDTEHRHKQIFIYKYVASSRLKSVCTALKEQFAAQFDDLDIKITNDEYVDRLPDTYTGCFFGDGCSRAARWSLALAMPPIMIPLIVREHWQRRRYEAGFVFRIRKRAIDAIERDMTRLIEQALQPHHRPSSAALSASNYTASSPTTRSDSGSYVQPDDEPTGQHHHGNVHVPSNNNNNNHPVEVGPNTNTNTNNNNGNNQNYNDEQEDEEDEDDEERLDEVELDGADIPVDIDISAASARSMARHGDSRDGRLSGQLTPADLSTISMPHFDSATIDNDSGSANETATGAAETVCPPRPQLRAMPNPRHRGGSLDGSLEQQQQHPTQSSSRI